MGRRQIAVILVVLVTAALAGGRAVAYGLCTPLDQAGSMIEDTTNGVTQTRDHEDSAHESQANEIVKINGSSANVDHDEAGNMIEVPILSGGLVAGHRACTYDAWNRLVTVKSDSGTTLATMKYDGLNRRTVKVGLHTSHYYHSGDSVVETRVGNDEDSTVHTQYVWGSTYIDELVQIGVNDKWDDDDEGAGVAFVKCDSFYWACQDANYNVTQLYDSDGALVERYIYTPHGRREVFIPADSDTFGTHAIGQKSQRVIEVNSEEEKTFSICDIGHQGLMYDKEIDLHYNRARYLESTLGRFTGRDPKEYIDGNNLYEYLRGNPPNGRDPMGTDYPGRTYNTRKRGEDGRFIWARETWVWQWQFAGWEGIRTYHTLEVAYYSGEPLDSQLGVSDMNILGTHRREIAVRTLARGAGMARAGMEMAMRLHPFSDMYELITGEDCISGEELTLCQRALAGAGIIVKGAGVAVAVGTKAIKATTKAQQVRRVLGVINKARKGKTPLKLGNEAIEMITDMKSLKKALAKATEAAGDGAAASRLRKVRMVPNADAVAFLRNAAKDPRFVRTAGAKYLDDAAKAIENGAEVTSQGIKRTVAEAADAAGNSTLARTIRQQSDDALIAAQARGVCFVAGTIVLTETGAKAIETVAAGERVWACDPQTGRWQLREVITPLQHAYEGEIVTLTVGDDRIEATENHPFWVVSGKSLAERLAARHVYPHERKGTKQGRWVDAGQLLVGDVVLLWSGKTAKVTALSVRIRSVNVYNLHVDQLHTYAVGTSGILVHNKPMRNGPMKKYVVEPAGDAQRGGRKTALSSRRAEEAVSDGTGIPLNRGPGRQTVPGTGPGGYRVPDLKVFGPNASRSMRGSIIEIKNAARISGTRQIRDLAAEAQRLGGHLEIFTNAPKPVRGHLARLIDAGHVVLRPLP